MPVCLLVGAGPGVGEAIARRFTSGGYSVGLISRDAAKLEAMAGRLSEADATVAWHAADAGDAVALEGALMALTDSLGPCDTLIYNAAVLKPATVLELETDRIEAELSVNLLGAHRAAKRVAPGMVERGRGAILFTGGGLALEPFPEWTSLALGKAALRSLSLSFYKELAPQGVHVSVIAICGIVAPGGPFDPERIAAEYWRLATVPGGIEDREVILQPTGTDPFYNDPERRYAETSRLPEHAR
ncbi:SDR family NAD(P)-dependent oxidoreductase [Nisaea sp.]|uniref:SDR family NAD(P)-dependent oxidoreductase n=1 Tax=Nisaea sp. TaxID=2024842 RepID=UPI003267189D